MVDRTPHGGEVGPDVVRALTSAVVNDPERLEALRSLDVLDQLPDPSFQRLVEMAARLLRVPVALMSFVDEDRQFFAAQTGLPEPTATARQTPLSHSFCQYVVGSGNVMAIEDARSDAVLHDNGAIDDLGVIAYAGVPIVDTDGHRLGSFCVIDSDPHDWTQDELEVLETLSLAIVHEVSLRRALDKERQAKQAATEALRSLLAIQQITATLSAAVGSDEVFEAVADVARQTGASEALLLLAPPGDPPYLYQRDLHGEGGRPEMLAVESHRLVRELDTYRDRAGTGPAPGRDAVPEEGGRTVWRITGARRTVGVLELTWAHRDDAVESTSSLVGAMVATMGPVVERIFLREAERSRSQELQLGLLPRRIPEVDGYDVDVTYVPAVEQLEVGGDWYDVVELQDDRLLLVVGDANGHSALAAATMASLRFGLRALARDAADPAHLLAELNRTAHRDRQLATLAVLVLDRATGAFSAAAAGHPPAIVTGRDGSTRLVEARGPMLGAVEDATFPAVEGALDPGEQLVLYTDGLVEGRRSPIDEGIEALRRAVPEAGPGEGDLDANGLVRRMARVIENRNEDDVALVVVRRRADGSG